MKFTVSGDGAKRASILIPMRVGLSDMVELVCWALTHDEGVDTVEDIPRLSKASVEKMCRDVLKRLGHESWGYWRDDVYTGFADEIEAQVGEQLDALFPEAK